MTFRELFDEKEFREIFLEIEEFAHEKLDKYIEMLQNQKKSKSGKEIFDAVWGNVEFSSGEIYILDSPLLQRLRGIKQLGLAHYVYCGCDYSRFYHTIGVTYLADRMADAINRCDLGTSDKQKEYFKAVVRLAAIFHDVGHMFMSHVSEHYFGKSPLYFRFPVIEKMLSQIKRKAKKENIALHELLSCMIVNTTAVQELLNCVKDYFDVELIDASHTVEELVEYISCLIVGVPVDRNILPYASIINGPIDADKCDYLSRDSHVTRVPVAVDISRLTQKLSVVENEDVSMSDLWHDNVGDKKTFYILAMKDSAEKALFQLCIARTIMFDSVYYHHKVLTAETEYRNILNQLANLDKPLFTSFREILNIADDDFNTYFFDAMKRERGAKDAKKIDQIQERIQNLYDRQLAKRVACLMPEFLEGTQGETENLFDEVLTSMDSEEGQDLMCAIKAEYAKIYKMCYDEDVNIEKLNVFVIQAPTIVFRHSKIQVPIDLRNGNQREFKGYELVNSRETSSSASYIVSDAKDKILILMALQKVLVQKYAVKIKDEGLSCGKYDKKEISEICEKLFEKGYYDNLPQLIPDELLYGKIPAKSIKGIVEKYTKYEGPDGYSVNVKETNRFFKQVMAGCQDKHNCRTVLNGIERMLKKALFINREYVSKNLDVLLKQLNFSEEKLYVVPLGSLRDSAKHMMYFWNDKKTDIAVETEKTLNELLKMPETDQIIFFDDGSFSGTQLISIMQEYLGAAKKTKEHHVDELTEEEKNLFRQKKLVFFFVAFNKAKEAGLKEELAELGLNNVKFYCIEDLSRGYLQDNSAGIFEDEEQLIMVRNFLSEVGYSIMKSKKMPGAVYKEGWNEQRIQEASLGYNDAQQMVFLKSSVPTYTITAFWQSGEFNGMEWEPLFKRTEK